LEKAKDAGDIRAWGVAGEPAPTVEVAGRMPVRPNALQIRDNIFLRSIDRLPRSAPTFLITFGLLGQALGCIMRDAGSRPDVRRQWLEQLGIDPQDTAAIGQFLIRDAIARNPSGVVLFTTVNTAKLRDAAHTAANAANLSSQDLEMFRRLARSEPGASLNPTGS
jgi:hypothetical protein